MFEIRQCTQPDCRLRMPIDPAVHRGLFCPRCGAPMERVVDSYQHRQPAGTTRPKRKVSVLLDNIRSAYNVGAIFRTADGIGAAHLYLCGFTPNPGDNAAISKTALGAEKSVSWSAHPNGLNVGRDLRAKGCRLLALETTDQSRPIYEISSHDFETQPLLLIVGNEQAGMDPGLLELCDRVLSVPMVGAKASLNVAVAFGVAAYWLAFS